MAFPRNYFGAEFSRDFFGSSSDDEEENVKPKRGRPSERAPPPGRSLYDRILAQNKLDITLDEFTDSDSDGEEEEKGRTAGSVVGVDQHNPRTGPCDRRNGNEDGSSCTDSVTPRRSERGWEEGSLELSAIDSPADDYHHLAVPTPEGVTPVKKVGTRSVAPLSFPTSSLDSTSISGLDSVEVGESQRAFVAGLSTLRSTSPSLRESAAALFTFKEQVCVSNARPSASIAVGDLGGRYNKLLRSTASFLSALAVADEVEAEERRVRELEAAAQAEAIHAACTKRVGQVAQMAHRRAQLRTGLATWRDRLRECEIAKMKERNIQLETELERMRELEAEVGELRVLAAEKKKEEETKQSAEIRHRARVVELESEMKEVKRLAAEREYAWKEELASRERDIAEAEAKATECIHRLESELEELKQQVVRSEERLEEENVGREMAAQTMERCEKEVQVDSASFPHIFAIDMSVQTELKMVDEAPSLASSESASSHACAEAGEAGGRSESESEYRPRQFLPRMEVTTTNSGGEGHVEVGSGRGNMEATRTKGDNESEVSVEEESELVGDGFDSVTHPPPVFAGSSVENYENRGVEKGLEVIEASDSGKEEAALTSSAHADVAKHIELAEVPDAVSGGSSSNSDDVGMDEVVRAAGSNEEIVASKKGLGEESSARPFVGSPSPRQVGRECQADPPEVTSTASSPLSSHEAPAEGHVGPSNSPYGDEALKRYEDELARYVQQLPLRHALVRMKRYARRSSAFRSQLVDIIAKRHEREALSALHHLRRHRFVSFYSAGLFMSFLLAAHRFHLIRKQRGGKGAVQEKRIEEAEEEQHVDSAKAIWMRMRQPLVFLLRSHFIAAILYKLGRRMRRDAQRRGGEEN